ncbi:MAG TPA: elongation factor G [Acidobacteriota bacterium]|nr:elongation factor G [Acidobacteriota bacterium]
MKDYTTDNVRNLCLAGQRGCGKTSLADAIAFCAGANNRIGSVDDGSSLLDYTDAEISRKTSIASKLLAFEWKKLKLNLLDCPGHPDFVGGLLSSIHVSDSVGMVIDSVAGVEIGTQLQWRMLPDNRPARFFFVNKMEKENANWNNSLESIKSTFGKGAVAVQLPIGQAESFNGLVDLLHMKAYKFDTGGERTETEIPEDLKDRAQAERESLIEVAAEADDSLMEKFFDEGTLSHEDIVRGLRLGIARGTLFPVLCGSALGNVGVKVLLDFIAEYLPSFNQMPPLKASKSGTDKEVELSPDPAAGTVAYVFKTVSEGHLGEMTFFRTICGTARPGTDLANQQTRTNERIAQIYSFQGRNRIEISVVPAGDIGVVVKLKNTHTGDTLAEKGLSVTVGGVAYPNPVMDMAVTSKSKGDEDKISAGLSKLKEEDPTFRLVADPALKQQVLYAQGSMQIDFIMERLKTRFGVEAELTRPKIPYRETVRGKTENQYRHKKQTGGRGQYGDVHLRIEALKRGGGFEFVDQVKGGVIPNKYIPAVEKGIVEAMQHGGLAKAPVVDVRVALFFGSYHDVDSSDMAFKIAGLMAFKEGFMQCNPVLLEPIYSLEVLVPDEFTGDVMGDLSSRRAKIAGMDPEGRYQRIRASVPQAELYQYSVDLRSMTQGQGVFTMEFARYEEVPHEQTQKIIAQAKADQEAENK